MELSIVFFFLAALFLCVGIYKIATRFKRETRDTSGQISNLQTNKFSSDMNRFAARAEIAPSVSRRSLAIHLSQETEAVSTLGAAQVSAITAQDAVENAPARLAELRRQEEAAHNNLLVTTEEATRLKVTLLALDEIRKDEERSRIKIGEHQQLAQIDVQKDYDIRINQLKAVLALKTFPYMKLAEIKGQIYNLLLEDATVADNKELPASVRAEYRMLLQDTIAIYRRTYERGLRLLQGVDGGEKLGGIDGFAELGSGVTDDGKAADDEI